MTDCPSHIEARERLADILAHFDGASDDAVLNIDLGSPRVAVTASIKLGQLRTLLDTPTQGEDISPSRDHDPAIGSALEAILANAVRAAGPIIDQLIERQYNVDYWGLADRKAALDAALRALSSAKQVAGRGPGMRNNTSATPTQEGVGREEIARLRVGQAYNRFHGIPEPASTKQPAPGAPEGWREAIYAHATDASDAELEAAQHVLKNLIHYRNGCAHEEDDARTIVAVVRAALTSSSAKPVGEGKFLGHLIQYKDGSPPRFVAAGKTPVVNKSATVSPVYDGPSDQEREASAQSNRRLREGLEKADEAWTGLKQTTLAASAVGVELANAATKEGYGLHLTLALRAALKDNGHG